MSKRDIDRRRFIVLGSAAVAGLSVGPLRAQAAPRPPPQLFAGDPARPRSSPSRGSRLRLFVANEPAGR